MTASLIDGIALAAQTRQTVAQQAMSLKAQGVIPTLAVVLVGDNPASQVYVRHKIKACEETGLRSVQVTLPVSTSQEALLAQLQNLNEDPLVHGILVQLPLPDHLDVQKVIAAIAPEKDVDGFHVANAGTLITGGDGFLPCTPYGCLKMLDHIGYDVAGKHVVVIGRSNIVGKPMAMMLLARHATVTMTHSQTRHLAKITRQADVLIAAVGRPKMVDASMVQPGAVVIDVGINRLTDGKLCGDVDFEAVRPIASHITPVPGGVGPMTIAMLLSNTLKAAQSFLKLHHQ